MFPPWIVLHVPHDSYEIPEPVRKQFVLGDKELEAELLCMTDHNTLDLFSALSPNERIVRAPVSRLVVDVERFADDRLEPMTERGMGAIYTVTSNLKPLRRPLSIQERETLIKNYYRPHHDKLEQVVSAVLATHNRCLIIDCHSFPDIALPYELVDPSVKRPDICIGADEYHSSKKLSESFISKFRALGWDVRLNDPFSGALVPMSRYRNDSRVSAIMLEINRRLYIDEASAVPRPDFQNVCGAIKNICASAIDACYD
jgi:N-formylglutamate amidohydrolase